MLKQAYALAKQHIGLAAPPRYLSENDVKRAEAGSTPGLVIRTSKGIRHMAGKYIDQQYCLQID